MALDCEGWESWLSIGVGLVADVLVLVLGLSQLPHCNHRVPISGLTFDQLCLEFLCEGGGGDIKDIPVLSEEGEKGLIPQCGWPLSCNLRSPRPSWKPEQQPKLWTGQVCDLSGSLWGFFFSSGLENKSYIFGARPSVARTKEEPNTQKTFIYRRTPFILVPFLRTGNEMTAGLETWEIGVFPGSTHVLERTVLLALKVICNLWIYKADIGVCHVGSWAVDAAHVFQQSLWNMSRRPRFWC